MGISGLLHLLKPITRKIHIKEYAGQTVAIDGHVLLHRGAFGVASKLANNLTTDRYVQYFMFYIGLFRHFGVTPLVVFDGLPLPLKKVTNDDRHSKRDAKLAEGMRHQIQGNHALAEKCFQQSISIHQDMIRAVILELQKQKVQVIVAPYESDAQLTYLLKTNKVSAVVSEDSDLLVFGCSKVIYKLTREGNGEEIKYQDIFTLQEERLDQFTPDLFRQMCMLSGCDYLPSLGGMGLRTALKKFKHDFSVDTALRTTFGSGERYNEYKKEFYHAEMGFLYQWVYDADKKDYVRINPLPDHLESEAIELLGPKPSVKQLSILRVNKIIPNMQDAANHQQTNMPSHKTAVITLSVDNRENITVHTIDQEQELTKLYFARHLQSSDVSEDYLSASIYTLEKPAETDKSSTTYTSWIFNSKSHRQPTLKAAPSYTSHVRQRVNKPYPSKSHSIINEMIKYCDENKENIQVSK
ncbi:PIN domain-like protein [Gilbertella persicaria]|uniref:PIN domain-like protein n=1 Tax=Gilbertella persicaria TaxID=101096 RepID=UPI00221F4514|nr:PIN domain-like protein [Gilbertella persicaria]KAI8056530.1 PIN domain-like protein [Gilbertella persicaria]